MEGYIREGKCNFADKNGNLVSNQWLVTVSDFKDGYALVKREDGLWNFLSKEGKILHPSEWFVTAGNFCNGAARIQTTRNSLWNFITEDGKYLSYDWFTQAYDFTESGFAIVARYDNGYEYNFLNKDGNLLSNDEWFLEVKDFDESDNYQYAEVVRKNGKKDLIDRNGN